VKKREGVSRTYSLPPFLPPPPPPFFSLLLIIWQARWRPWVDERAKEESFFFFSLSPSTPALVRLVIAQTAQCASTQEKEDFSSFLLPSLLSLLAKPSIRPLLVVVDKRRLAKHMMGEFYLPSSFPFPFPSSILFFRTTPVRCGQSERLIGSG